MNDTRVCGNNVLGNDVRGASVMNMRNMNANGALLRLLGAQADRFLLKYRCGKTKGNKETIL